MDTTETPTVTPAPAPVLPPKTPLGHRLRLMFWKLVSLILLIGLVAAIVMWKPWQPNIKANERTISVTGSATIKAEPDEYIFNPTYSISNTDKQTALNQMTARSNDIVAKLKDLGVASDKIKTDSSNYSDLYSLSSSGTYTYDLSLTVTVDDKPLAQKVQDYLLTTSPSGSVTPQATFSTAKQKTLEDQARDKAEQDARAKADKSAKNLGFKVSQVKSVQDGSLGGSGGCGNGGLCMGSNMDIKSSLSASSSLSLQPGQNDLDYSVTVVYYIH